jgi:hypothetical protein
MNSKWAIKVDKDGFSHKEAKYLFSEVAHLFCSEKVTKTKLNVLITIGIASSFSIRVTFRNGHKIEILLDEQGIFWGSNKDLSNEITELKKAVSEIYQATFAQRLEPFESEIAGKGFFTYDECRFYPNTKIVFRDKEFFLNNLSFRNYGFAIELMPKNMSLMDKIIRANYPFKTPQFNTQTDHDVISHLLLKYFRIKI